MIGVVAIFHPRAGMEMEFERVMIEFAKKVRKKEKGVVYFDFYRHAQAPTAYTMVEKYKDETAFIKHGETPYLAEVGEQLSVLLEQQPEMHILHQVF